MNSSLVILAAGIAAAVVIAVPHALASDTTSAFLEQHTTSTTRITEIPVKGRVRVMCRELLGSPYARDSIPCAIADTSTAWVLEAPGKHGLIRAGVVITNGTVTQLSILEDREQRGRPIRTTRYQRQFSGVALTSDGRPTRRLDAITGATISSQAVAKMVLLALHLDDWQQKQTD